MKLEALLSKRGKEYFYIMHLSYEGSEREELWNYGKKNNVIGLSKSIVNNDWVKVGGSVKNSLSNTWIRQFDTFCNEMNAGDVVLVLKGWDSLLGVAEIKERRHKYSKKLKGRKGPFFDHIRDVTWIKEHEFDARRRLPKPVKGFNNTLSKVTPNSKWWPILVGLDI